MSSTEYVVKSLPSRTVAAARASVGSQAEIAGVVEPLFGQVARAVEAAGAVPETGVAVYDVDPGRGPDQVLIVVGYDYVGEPAAGVEIVALPAVEQCVSVLHRGSMAAVGDSWQQLMAWLEPHGWAVDGPAREVYLRAWPPEDQSEWVTELQQPVRRG